MLSWQVRILFAKKEAYCQENLTHLPTWEYAFNSFMYSSFITREDNVYNRAIHDYLTGEDALLESQRIEEEIMNISIDMWEY
jgi:predicted nucleotide-binding protein (sugar kinase/HSP70/actin superfamily)